MMKLRTWTIAAAVAFTLGGCAATQNTSSHSATTSNTFTLEQLYQDKVLEVDQLGSIRWLPDGHRYTAVEASAAHTDAKDIIVYDARSQSREVLIDAAQLIPKGADAPLVIDDYQWNSDHSMLLIYTKSQKVWRSNSRGDYWLLNINSGELVQLGGDAEASSLMFAKFAPNDQAIAYVYKNNLFVESLSDNKITQLTQDGDEQIVNGIFDWVYEEEFGIADGFMWSPDSTHIAYWQLDTAPVRNFTMINNTDGLYPTLTTFPYPKAGEDNSIARVGVVNISNTETRWVDLPETEQEGKDYYIPRMSWAGNGDGVMIQKVNRLQNTNEHVLVDVNSGVTDVVYVDRDDAFFEWYYNVEWLDNGQTFLKISERDGWRHIYRINRDGSQIVDLTPGEFDVIALTSVDEENGWLYFTASVENVTQQYLYRTRLDGQGEREIITSKDWIGHNSYQISPDAKLAVHTYSNFRTPYQYRIINLPEHTEVRTLIDNQQVADALAAKNLGELEFFQVPSFDGLMLDGYIMRPPQFDASKQYPIIFFVYGEPWGQTVKDAWDTRGRQAWFEYLTQQGYIVASIDNRGTKSPRGRDWRKSVYRQIGTVTAKDQAAALDAMAKRWSYIDTDHVGIWGHSGGGSMTLNMLFRFPEKYHVGIASAPVPDIRLYDTIYQERYVGLPDTYKMDTGLDAYDQASPITFAHQLQGELLLIHGTGDDNVHYQGAERLINELVKHNKQFEFMAYPNRSHSLREGEGTDLHRMTLMTEFFNKHLKK